ncbi:MAG: manganese efflux pump [Traorella sp.]
MIPFIILFICITLDAFIYMMEKGATIRNLNLKTCLSDSLIFASINTFVYLVANRISYTIFSKTILLKFYQRISVIILVTISVLILVKTINKKTFVEKLNLDVNYKESIKQALITSIDTLLIGITASMLSHSIYIQLVLAFLITFILVFAALYIGYTRGAAYQKIIGYSAATGYLIVAILQALQIFSIV